MTQHISRTDLQLLLGIHPAIPLGIDAMCGRLRLAIAPAPAMSPRLERFMAALADAFRECGVELLGWDDASGSNGRISAGTAVIAPGSFPDSQLPINRVSTLYDNIIVGVYDEPPPVEAGDPPQQALDAIVGRLAWEMVHMLVYVTDRSWTICTMNGGITTIDMPLPVTEDVRRKLVPKLTAGVVPPRAGDLEIRNGALEPSGSGFASIAVDFAACARIWSGNPVLVSHTSRESLGYRSEYYRKIVSKYLDDRSGMSYGFFARQLPVKPAAATVMDGSAERAETGIAPGRNVSVSIAGRRLLVPVPDVRILTTRSGCRKTAIDPRFDLVETGTDNGRPYLATPGGLPSEIAARPSFDTMAIIAHAVGNALASSILQAVSPNARFPAMLAERGAGMTHWHHYPETDDVPEGYVVHGLENPPVSCSTPQSAAYSLLGKLDALERSVWKGAEYLGDMHIEPGHGTNMVGVLSLEESARIMNRAAARP